MSNPRALRGLLLDLDGTLADTAPDLAAALNLVRIEEGLTELPLDQIRSSVSHGAPRLVRLGFGEELADDEFERLRLRLLHFYSQAICTHTTLFPGFTDVLQAIEDQGHRWGVVTNKPGWLTAPLMSALKLDHRAGSVVSGDTLEQRKPHPAPLLHAASDMEIAASACIYVGDAQRDIEAGRAAGMFTVAVRWGYIPEDENIDDWNAHQVIDEPEQLLEIIMRPRSESGHGLATDPIT
jgi:N-acetyl-D-muramate 6-phosphate phosphatase